jgi:hypothetical protein
MSDLFKQLVPTVIAGVAGYMLGPQVAAVTKGAVSASTASGFISKTVAGLTDRYDTQSDKAGMPTFKYQGRSISDPNVARINALQSVLNSSKFQQNFYGASALRQLADASYIKALKKNNLLSLDYNLPKEKLTSAPTSETIRLGSEKLS